MVFFPMKTLCSNKLLRNSIALVALPFLFENAKKKSEHQSQDKVSKVFSLVTSFLVASCKEKLRVLRRISMGQRKQQREMYSYLVYIFKNVIACFWRRLDRKAQSAETDDVLSCSKRNTIFINKAREKCVFLFLWGQFICKKYLVHTVAPAPFTNGWFVWEKWRNVRLIFYDFILSIDIWLVCPMYHCIDDAVAFT